MKYQTDWSSLVSPQYFQFQMGKRIWTMTFKIKDQHWKEYLWNKSPRQLPHMTKHRSSHHIQVVYCGGCPGSLVPTISSEQRQLPVALLHACCWKIQLNNNHQEYCLEVVEAKWTYSGSILFCNDCDMNILRYSCDLQNRIWTYTIFAPNVDSKSHLLSQYVLISDEAELRRNNDLSYNTLNYDCYIT